MRRISGKIRIVIAIGLALVISLSGGCTSLPDFDDSLSSIVKPHRFSIINWELKTLLSGDKQSNLEEKVEDEPNQVTRYFSLVELINTLKSEIKATNTDAGSDDSSPLETELSILEEQRAALENVVRKIMTRQIKEILAEQGIFNPVDKYLKLKVGFPPINFRLEQPPHLLVISPRDRIESIREITLEQNISL